LDESVGYKTREYKSKRAPFKDYINKREVTRK